MTIRRRYHYLLLTGYFIKRWLYYKNFDSYENFSLDFVENINSTIHGHAEKKYIKKKLKQFYGTSTMQIVIYLYNKVFRKWFIVWWCSEDTYRFEMHMFRLKTSKTKFCLHVKFLIVSSKMHLITIIWFEKLSFKNI